MYEVHIIYMDPIAERLESKTIKADTIQAAKGIVSDKYYNDVYGMGYKITCNDTVLETGGLARKNENCNRH